MIWALCEALSRYSTSPPALTPASNTHQGAACQALVADKTCCQLPRPGLGSFWGCTWSTQSGSRQSSKRSGTHTLLLSHHRLSKTQQPLNPCVCTHSVILCVLSVSRMPWSQHGLCPAPNAPQTPAVADHCRLKQSGGQSWHDSTEGFWVGCTRTNHYTGKGENYSLMLQCRNWLMAELGRWKRWGCLSAQQKCVAVIPNQEVFVDLKISKWFLFI